MSRRWISPILVTSLLLGLTVSAAPVFAMQPGEDTPPEEPEESEPIVFPYSELELSSSVSKTEALRLLEAMAQGAYKKGFRYLGEASDFDHAHFLFAENERLPFAVLYHTQERAFTTHAQSPGSRYDYLDPARRNWLQIVDGSLRPLKPAEDAAAYRTTERRPEWQGYEEHLTIVSSMLDGRRLGRMSAREFQLSFTRMPCAPYAAQETPENNLARIQLPDAQRVCVWLTGNFFDPE